MTPWCDDLVCSWRRLLADRHSLPFPWTLSLHRRWCPSASHHPLTFLFLLALTFPLPSPFPSLGLSLCRPPCPSASPHSFPSLSLGRLCQRSPRTCPVSLLCVESTQRKANAFAVGQVRPSGHPKPGMAAWGGGRVLSSCIPCPLHTENFEERFALPPTSFDGQHFSDAHAWHCLNQPWHYKHKPLWGACSAIGHKTGQRTM